MIRYAYTIVLLLLLLPVCSLAQEDTAYLQDLAYITEDTSQEAADSLVTKDSRVAALPDTATFPTATLPPKLRQLRFGVDITKPLASVLLKDRMGIELMVDYYFRKELYLVAEGGGGSVRYHYPDLSYHASNTFLRLGIDKSMLPRMNPDDWDMVFIGARYGMALVQMSPADYTTKDPFWGETSGTLPARRFAGHWFEVTGGMRVEMVRGLFIGWNIRGRFLLNRTTFRESAPVYIAGYGKGDKNGVFDFNFYLSYTLRRNIDK